jgi:drug/metabolite transporter (DMT)-like permease
MIEMKSLLDEQEREQEEEDQDQDQEESDDDDDDDEDELVNTSSSWFSERRPLLIVLMCMLQVLNGFTMPLAKYYETVPKVGPLSLAVVTSLPQLVYFVLYYHVFARRRRLTFSYMKEWRLWLLSLLYFGYAALSNVAILLLNVTVARLIESLRVVAVPLACKALIDSERLPRYTLLASFCSLGAVASVLVGQIVSSPDASAMTWTDVLGSAQVLGVLVALGDLAMHTLFSVWLRVLVRDRVGGDRGTLLLIRNAVMILAGPLCALLIGDQWASWSSVTPAALVVLVALSLLVAVANQVNLESVEVFESPAVVSTLSEVKAVVAYAVSIAFLGERFAYIYQYAALVFVTVVQALYAASKAMTR